MIGVTGQNDLARQRFALYSFGYAKVSGHSRHCLFWRVFYAQKRYVGGHESRDDADPARGSGARGLGIAGLVLKQAALIAAGLGFLARFGFGFAADHRRRLAVMEDELHLFAGFRVGLAADQRAILALHQGEAAL